MSKRITESNNPDSGPYSNSDDRFDGESRRPIKRAKSDTPHQNGNAAPQGAVGNGCSNTAQVTPPINPTAFAPLDHCNGQESQESRLSTAKKPEVQGPSFPEDIQSVEATNSERISARQPTPPTGRCDTYGAVQGLKNSLHGVIYQLKLLMLFVKRGLQHCYSFSLATEMDKAEKFDDLVFRYKVDAKSETSYLFLQAKHKQDETEKITDKMLLTEAGDHNDFSLPKYFTSYRKMKNDFEFKGHTIKDLIIFTNIGFDSKGLEPANIFIKKVAEDDDLLGMESAEKKSARYKFNVAYESELWKILKRSSDVHKLAKILVEHIHKSKDITLKPDLFRRYRLALAEEVIDCKNGKFHDDFIEGDLSENGEKFRHRFHTEACKQFKKDSGKNPDDGAIWKKIKESRFKVCPNFDRCMKSDPELTRVPELAEELARLIKLAKVDNEVRVDGHTYNEKAKKSGVKVFVDNMNQLAGYVLVIKDKKIKFNSQFLQDIELPGTLGNLRNLLESSLPKEYRDLAEYTFKMPASFATIEEELLYGEKEWPEDEINGTDIGDFFDKLIFAVNQPDEIKLGDLITGETSTLNSFDLLDADLVGAYFQKEMLDWFKEKGKKKGQEGRYYSNLDARDFFASVERKVNSLLTSEWSKAYP